MAEANQNYNNYRLSSFSNHLDQWCQAAWGRILNSLIYLDITAFAKMPFLHPGEILKGSGISLSSTLNFFSYSFFKSCSTSKAVFTGITVFSIADKTGATN